MVNYSERWPQTVRTGILLLSIPVTLAILHWMITPDIRTVLIFDHSRFNVYTLWTSAYVHRNIDHLNGNLLGYSVALAALWPIFYRNNTQKELRNIVLAFLIVLPPLISVSDYLVYRYLLNVTDQVATRGFSGIVAALFGLLLVIVVKEVHTICQNWQRTTNYFLALILSILGGIVLYSGIGTLVIYISIVVGLVLVVFGVIPLDKLLNPGQMVQDIKTRPFQIGLISYGSAVLVFLVPALFPVNWIHQQSVTNIFGHAAGLLFGGLFGGGLVLLTLTEWGRTEVRKRSYLKPLLTTKLNIAILRRMVVLAILFPILFAAVSYHLTSTNAILTGATVLYASLLLFREIPTQPALEIESTDIAVHTDGSFIVSLESRNIGTATAEDVVAHSRIYDPKSDTSSFWVEGESLEDDPDERVDVEPSHYQHFGVSIDEEQIPNGIFTENVRIESKIGAVNQSYTTYDVLGREALDKYNEFVKAIKQIAAAT